MYTVPSLSYNHLHINTNKPPRNNTPLAQNAKLREALDLAIDRKALVQAVSNGVFLPGNQLVPPTSPYYIREFPVQPRNVARAKELIKEAGFTRVPVNMQILNATLDLQVAQIVQAMAREVGFDITIEPEETDIAVARYFAGDFELFGGLWSGRRSGQQPATFIACNAGQNFTKYCNPELDKWLVAGRQRSDLADATRPTRKPPRSTWPNVRRYRSSTRFGCSPRRPSCKANAYVDGIVRPVGLSLAKYLTAPMVCSPRGLVSRCPRATPH